MSWEKDPPEGGQERCDGIRDGISPFFIICFDENLNIMQTNHAARIWHGLDVPEVVNRTANFSQFAHLYYPTPDEAKQAILKALDGFPSYFMVSAHGDTWIIEYGPTEAYRGCYCFGTALGRLRGVIKHI